MTNQIWQFYIHEPHGFYKQELLPNNDQHSSSYVQKPGIDSITGEYKIELHFNNRRRGQLKSDFSQDYVPDRVKELTTLFKTVKSRANSEADCEPKWVTLVSWMNNFASVVASLPPEFVSSRRVLKPPELNFRSNSLWG